MILEKNRKQLLPATIDQITGRGSDWGALVLCLSPSPIMLIMVRIWGVLVGQARITCPPLWSEGRQDYMTDSYPLAPEEMGSLYWQKRRVLGGQKLCMFILPSTPFISAWHLSSQWQTEKETLVFICTGSVGGWLKEIWVIVPFSQLYLFKCDPALWGNKHIILLFILFTIPSYTMLKISSQLGVDPLSRA